MGNLTVLTLVPNAGDRLERCLESVRWADRVMCVVDPATSDGSDEVAGRFTDWVLTHPYENAASQRNWALPQIETEWTLVLDADEWVSDELRARIEGITSESGGPDGYSILRRSYFLGKLIEHCGWHKDYNLRLFRTAKGRYLDKRVHSKVVVDGETGVLNEVMYHDTYRNFEEYFTTFQRFTTWGAEDAYDAGKRTHLVDLTLRPVLRFLKMYVVRHGFRDGYHGAVLCGLAACSVFTKYAKLWYLEHRGPNESPGDKGERSS